MPFIDFLKKYTGVIFFLLLLAYTIFGNTHIFYYDEPYYYHNVNLLNEFGFGPYFLKNLNGPAGPLHSVLFWLLQPLTGNNVIMVRLVNVGLLLSIIFISRKIFVTLNKEKLVSKDLTLGFMSIPMVFVCGGMALTEMPALFALTVSVWLFLKADMSRFDWRWILAGLFLALAITGRQPYLLLLLPYSMLFLSRLPNWQKLPNLFIFLVLSLSLPLYCFSVWNGIAPITGGDIASRELFDPYFLFLGLGYSFLILMILDRSLVLTIPRKYPWVNLLLFSISFLLCYMGNLRQPLMNTFISKILPPAAVDVYALVVASILLTAGLIFLVSILYLVILHFQNNERIFLYIGLLLIIISCGKITHQFSSRYIFQAALFFVLILPVKKQDNIQYLLSLAGSIIGFISLYTYKI